MDLKIFAPTPDGFKEMTGEHTKEEEEQLHKDMACWKTQNHLKECVKCQKKLTAAENLAEDTARDEDWGLKTECDPLGEDEDLPPEEKLTSEEENND